LYLTIHLFKGSYLSVYEVNAINHLHRNVNTINGLGFCSNTIYTLYWRIVHDTSITVHFRWRGL